MQEPIGLVGINILHEIIDWHMRPCYKMKRIFCLVVVLKHRVIGFTVHRKLYVRDLNFTQETLNRVA